MLTQKWNTIDALMDGFTGTGLFRRISYPGAPKYAIDPRPTDEILNSTGLARLIPRLPATKPREGNEQAKEATGTA